MWLLNLILSTSLPPRNWEESSTIKLWNWSSTRRESFKSWSLTQTQLLKQTWHHLSKSYLPCSSRLKVFPNLVPPRFPFSKNFKRLLLCSTKEWVWWSSKLTDLTESLLITSSSSSIQTWPRFHQFKTRQTTLFNEGCLTRLLRSYCNSTFEKLNLSQTYSTWLICLPTQKRKQQLTVPRLTKFTQTTTPTMFKTRS